MRIGKKQIAELIEAVSEEGNPRVLFAPIPALPAGVALPRAWQQLLTQENAHKQVTNLLWAGAAKVVPLTVAAIKEKLQAVGLLITDTKAPSLIYVFTEDGEVLANRGYPPSASLPAISKKLSVDLSIIYAIHDGWVDLFSPSGLLPREEWETLGKAKTAGFLKIADIAGSAMGFDLSEHPAGSYSIDGDGEVEKVSDFWGELDSWMSDELEDMDRSKT